MGLKDLRAEELHGNRDRLVNSRQAREGRVVPIAVLEGEKSWALIMLAQGISVFFMLDTIAGILGISRVN